MGRPPSWPAGWTPVMDQGVNCHLQDGKIAEAWEIADVGWWVDQ